MYEDTMFPKRLKVLRLSHSLTHVQLARLCIVKNKSIVSQAAISSWENRKKPGSLDSMYLMCDIFGVSADWLLGRSDDIYTEGVFAKLEPKSFPIQLEFNGKVLVLDELQFPEEYTDICRRKEYYSNEARANIIYLLYNVEYEAMANFRDKCYDIDYSQDERISAAFKRLMHYMIDVAPDMNNLRMAVQRLKQVLESRKAIFLVKE